MCRSMGPSEWQGVGTRMPRRAGDGKQSSINHGAAVIALETPRHSKRRCLWVSSQFEDVFVSLNELVKGKSWVFKRLPPGCARA